MCQAKCVGWVFYLWLGNQASGITALAQATTSIATAPKSNRSGLAYWAAVGDVEARGSMPVPLPEATLAARMTAREEARAASKAAGKAKPNPFPAPEIARGGDIMRTRETNRKKLAETEKRDASD